MLQRTLHAIVTLVALIVAYECYALVAVPWLEPPLAIRAPRRVTPDQRNRAVDAVSKYQRVLAAYFPADHWSQTQPPKVVENATSTVMVVWDKHTIHDDGRVDIDHCCALVFPTPRTESPEPPRDAIIINAPQGARLQFDDTFRPERMQMGQITRGVFPGRITIHSDMSEPGPEDDLLVETRDLKMNSKLLYTEHEVHFRMGPNVGNGRELEIRLLEEDPSPSNRNGLKIAGVDQLEIRYDVRLRASLGAVGLLPGEDQEGPKPVAATSRRLPPAGTTPPAATTIADDADKPPTDIRSDGPFRFDFVRYIASFDENVKVSQANADGPNDRLTCSQLDIHFARPGDADSVASNLAPSEQPNKNMRSLNVEKVVAQGHPVIVASPSRQAEARGGRIQLMVRQRRIVLDGGQDVQLTSGANIIRAPRIQYDHPAADAATKIGSFRADGPGTLTYLPDEKKPDQVLHASWQASVRLGRHNGQPVLTFAGRPNVAVTGMGRVMADQIRISLREVEADGKTRPIPDRMSAVGQVEIDSPELLARTRDLIVTFQSEPDVPTVGAATGRTADGRGNSDDGKFRFAKTRSGPAARVYQVSADAIALEVGLRGRRAVPLRLSCDHNVEFREVGDPNVAGEQPLEVRGGRLTADRLDAEAQVTIFGAPPDQPTGGPPAEIHARGMTVWAADVRLDEATNRLWIEGPGKATVVVRRDLTGRPSGNPYPMEIHWQGGLEFDGHDVVIRRNVVVFGADDRLQCDQLIGTLSAPVEFGKRVDQDSIDLAEIECRGNVTMDHRSRDTVGVTSHDRIELTRLTINQLNGAMSGDGPGVIRSTHLANQLDALGGSPPSAQPRAAKANTTLRFLRVDFQRGLAGNIFTREIAFFERVRTVYGPIDAWEQELDMNRFESLPPDTITLTCNELRINEDPLAAAQVAAVSNSSGSVGPVQMRAEGNVRIDGDTIDQGKFSATAARAAYEQAKEVFILEGSDRAPATLWHREQAGGNQIDHAARKIRYDRRTNQVQVDGVRRFEFVPGKQ